MWVSEKRRKDKRMSEHTYTVAHLQDPENGADLRRLAGEVLNPGPWQHKWSIERVGDDTNGRTCLKCKCYQYQRVSDDVYDHVWAECQSPDPATGSLPDIAEQLLRQVVANDRLPELEDVILAYPLLCNAMGFVNPYRELLLLSPTDRAICCLLVLLPAKVIVE